MVWPPSIAAFKNKANILATYICTVKKKYFRPILFYRPVSAKILHRICAGFAAVAGANTTDMPVRVDAACVSRAVYAWGTRHKRGAKNLSTSCLAKRQVCKKNAEGPEKPPL